MFREDNRCYYRPDNGDLDHSVTITRPLKKKELLDEKQYQLNAAIRNQKWFEEKNPDDTEGKKLADERVRKLRNEIAALENNKLQHKVRHTTKKLKPDTVFDYCCLALKQSIANDIHFITAEDVAYQMNTPVHLVKQCFARMNLMGWLSQPCHKLPHDCYRPDWSQWAADCYYIQDKAKAELCA